MRLPLALAAVWTACAATAALPAQASVPVAVEIEVDTSRLARRGRAVATLHFDPLEAIDRRLGVRLDVERDGELLLRRDHAPPTPTTEWKPGEKVTYELPLRFPDLAVLTGENARRPLEIYVGFLDQEARDGVRPPRGAGRFADQRLRITTFEVPEELRSGGLTERRSPTERVTDALSQARALANAGDAGGAWEVLEFAFRGIDDYDLKGQLRDALFDVGKRPPPPLTFEERTIAAARLAREKARYLRLVAGRMYDREEYHGALMLLDEAGGALEENAGEAVLGAVDDAKRVERSRENIVQRIFAPDATQQAEADRLRSELGFASTDLLERGIALGKASRTRPVAWAILRRLGELNVPEVRDVARTELAALEKRWLAETPAEQARSAREAIDHPVWARTTTRASHRFVFLGPQGLLRSIPEDSLVWFDLAYVYLTDLFGRVPNPGGDRVTVFFKELWDFGGGVGGGKTIDIGNADPEARGTRVDTSLLFHELTHCVSDTSPMYGGMNEGIADFGAAFLLAELGRRAQARAAIGRALGAFQKDYLERDLEYWRIPEYAPSAGFFLHFIVRHSGTRTSTDDTPADRTYAWERYRAFFRAYRNCRVRDARTPTLARAFAHHLADAFGPAAFADLVRFRWPIVDSDLKAAAAEHDAAQAGRRATDARDFESFEGSPIPRDLLARELVDDDAEPQEHRDSLGVVLDWHVIGPFKQPDCDPDAFVFPPEYEIDFDKRYPGNGNNRPFWRVPGNRPPIEVEPTGWLKYTFPYQDDSAIYAVTHITVEQDTDAWLHLRGDDYLTVFVNDRLVGKRRRTSARGGPWRPRGEIADGMRFAVTLHAGRNKLLVKIRNRGGPAGMIAALTTRNGSVLPGWTSDAEPPEAIDSRPSLPDLDRWRRLVRADYTRGGSTRDLDQVVGSFRARNRALEGTATDKDVEWRKYTVRPGFPKDSPSNLAWLRAKATSKVDENEFALELVLDFEDRGPKLGVIVQGDGGRDALSGHTLLLAPSRGGIRTTLERYDRLVYQAPTVPVPSERDNGLPLQIVVDDGGRRLTVRLGEEVLFDRIPIRPIRVLGDEDADAHELRDRIGFTTWGPKTRIRSLELRAPR